MHFGLDIWSHKNGQCTTPSGHFYVPKGTVMGEQNRKNLIPLVATDKRTSPRGMGHSFWH